MNANEIVAVVLAVPGEESAWGMERFALPVGGVPVLTRVHKTLTASGLQEVCLVHDGTQDVAALAPWTLDVRADVAATPSTLIKFVARRSLFVLLGDLPLLTAETIRGFLDAFAGGRSTELLESSGAMAAFSAGDRAERFLKDLARRHRLGAPDERGEGTWRAGSAADVRRLASPCDYPAIGDAVRLRKVAALAASGVLVIDAASTYADDAVVVGPRTTLLPGTHLRGESTIGSDCVIGPDAWIESSVVEGHVAVRYSVLEECRVREGSMIGPFAHLRRGSDVGPEAKVGNYVEVKASRLGHGVKAGHLSYLGDADIGDGTNVGAGTITCNYDGASKHRTVVGDDVFIGSHVALVAPVTIGRGAFLAAGSTITEDVPPETLAIARARQVLKERTEKPSGEET